MNQAVSVWDVLTVILLPIALLAIGFLWSQINSIRKDVSSVAAENAALRVQLGAHALDAEKRYVNWALMNEFKYDILKRFDRLEMRLDRLVHDAEDDGAGNAS